MLLITVGNVAEKIHIIRFNNILHFNKVQKENIVLMKIQLF